MLVTATGRLCISGNEWNMNSNQSLFDLKAYHEWKFPHFLWKASRAKRKARRFPSAKAILISDPDDFQVGRFLGSYGFMNITSNLSFQSGGLSNAGRSEGLDLGYSSEDIEQLRVQEVGEGQVKIRLYEGRVTQGPLKGTRVIFKAYPGKLAGGIEADLMAANELSAHAFLQDDPNGICQNIQILLGGFETKTGEQKTYVAQKLALELNAPQLKNQPCHWSHWQMCMLKNPKQRWLAFRDDGKYSAADYAKAKSEAMSKDSAPGGKNFWNPFDWEQKIKHRRFFVIKLLRGAISGLLYMHDRDRLHQSLGPSSVTLNTIAEKEATYLAPRLRDLAFSVDVRYSSLEAGPGALSESLWRRASAAGAFTPLEKRSFGIADDIYEAGLLFAYLAFVPFCEAGAMDGLSLQRLFESAFRLDLKAARDYCEADDRLVEAVKFLDLGNGAGWELLQAMLNPDFRQRPIAEAVLNHRFMTGAVL